MWEGGINKGSKSASFKKTDDHLIHSPRKNIHINEYSLSLFLQLNDNLLRMINHNINICSVCFPNQIIIITVQSLHECCNSSPQHPVLIMTNSVRANKVLLRISLAVTPPQAPPLACSLLVLYRWDNTKVGTDNFNYIC